MPVYKEIDVGGSAYLGDPNVQTKVVFQLDSIGLWFKKDTVWEGWPTLPSGKLSAKNLLALIPNPQLNTVYQPTVNGNVLFYHGTKNPVNIYFEQQGTQKIPKCGIPPL